MQDVQGQIFAGIAKFGMCAGVAICCAVSTLPLIFFIFMTVYAFANPDKEAWYGKVGETNALYTNEDALKEANAAEMINIHGRFVSWFVWGFWMQIAPIGLLAITFSVSCCSAVGATILGIVLYTGLTCSMLAWWICGIVWRFRTDGKFAAGDLPLAGQDELAWKEAIRADGSLYQVNSGNFLYYYYVITWVMMGLGLVVAVVIPVAICCCMAKAAEELQPGGDSEEEQEPLANPADSATVTV